MVEQQTDNIKDSFCVLPWIHLATHPIGTVTPCCVTEMKNSMSTATTEESDMEHLFLSKDSLESITNSKRFKAVRKDMMNGVKPLVCQKCFKYEDQGVGSKRQEANTLYAKHIKDCLPNTNPDGSLIKVNYKYVELRLGTVCNLKCTTCNPFSSNRWHQDLPGLKGTEFENDYYKVDIKTEWYRDYKFYDELYSKCDNLQEIWINGGEPTLIKEHAYFLEKFIEDGSSKDIDLHYSLNCTQFPDKFIEIWKSFKNIRIHLSIDDIEERNYYVRFPSDWNQIMKSLNKILKYRDIFTLELCQTVSCLNVFNIDNFKKFADDSNLFIAHNYVHYPDHMHVSLIPDEMKAKILSNIKYLEEHEIHKLKVELDRKPNHRDADRFYSFIRIMDRTRNVKIYDYLPEWEPYKDKFKIKAI